MRLWADVYDAAGVNRLGAGGVMTLASADFTQVLDGIGSFQIAAPGGDQRALDLFQLKRRITLYREDDGRVLEIGRGVIEGIKQTGGGGNVMVAVSGTDSMQELKNVITPLGKTYAGQPALTILDDLARRAGWTVNGAAPISHHAVTNAVPAHYYRFDDLAGSTALDLGYLKQDAAHVGGVALGAPSLISGDANLSLGLSGAGAYVVLPSLDLTNRSFTIAMWVRFAASPPPFQEIFSVFSLFEPRKTFYLRIYDTGYLAVDWYLSGGSIATEPGLSSFGGAPMHLAFTYQQSSGVSTIYINGVSMASGQVGGFIGSAPVVQIGAFTAATAAYLKGGVDEFSYYERALGAEEIALQYNAGANVLTGNVVSERVDGESILAAMQAISKRQGLHFRYHSPKKVEVGAFGAASGIRAVNLTTANRDVYLNDDVMVIDRMTIASSSREICNVIVPTGAGQGAAALTLEKATRTAPYTIQTGIGAGGDLFYYLEDAASIAQYGRIERRIAFRDIGPVENTDEEIENAANALYDAAATWLERRRDIIDTYAFSLLKPSVNLTVGAKLHLRYKGIVYSETGEVYTYRDINTDLWILSAQLRYTSSGASLDVKVSTVDRDEDNDPVKQVAVAIKKQEQTDTKVQPVPSRSVHTYTLDIAPGFHAPIPILLTDTTLNLDRVSVKVRLFKLRSNYNGSAFGVFEDAAILPTGVQVYLNGVDQTAALGGPYTDNAFEIPSAALTELIKGAVGGLRQEHTLELRAGGGRGRIEAQVEVWEFVQSIRAEKSSK